MRAQVILAKLGMLTLVLRGLTKFPSAVGNMQKELRVDEHRLAEVSFWTYGSPR